MFMGSAVFLLAAMMTALLLTNVTRPTRLIVPADPVLAISTPSVFWLLFLVELAILFVCLRDGRPERPLLLLVWLAVMFVVYRIGLWWMGYPGLAVILPGIANAFGISARLAGVLADAGFAYLMMGSCLTLVLLTRERKSERYLEKMFCPACGGHIQFPVANLGQATACPHCQAAVRLRRRENLKMSCFFCAGHIEFPAHALGTKMPCPHCRRDITLKEPA
jgi:hypothetical protein